MAFDNLTITQLAAAVAAFALVLGGLHFLRVRRRRVRVSSTHLWRQLAAHEKPRVLWHRWRDLVSFAAVMSMGALLLLALAGPRWHDRRRQRALVIVVDTGHSMRAREANGERRWDQARREADRLLARLRADDRVALVAAGVENRAVVPLTPYRPALRDSLRQLEPSDATANLAGALELARAVAGAQRNGEIVLISDRAPVSADGEASRVDYVRIIHVGARGDNAAITALSLSPPTVRNAEATIEVAVTNSSAQPLAAPLVITLEGKEQARRRLQQAPHTTETYRAGVLAPNGGRLTVSLDFDDALPEDNRVEAQLPRPSAVRVLLAPTLRQGAVSRALAVDADFHVTVGGLASSLGTNDDVVVTDGASSLTRPTLFLTPDHVPIAHAGEVVNQRLVASDISHSVTAGFEFKDVTLAHAVVWTMDASRTPLGVADTKPVLIASDEARTGQRFIAPGWRLDDESTGFTRRPQFVAFVARAIRWLAGYPQQRSVVARLGALCRVEFQHPGEVKLTLPDGSVETLGSAGAGFEFMPRHVGVHTFVCSRGETVYLNAIREGAAFAEVAPGSSETTRAPRSFTAAPRPLWISLTLLALLLLMAEWWAYLRRVTV